MNEKYTYAAYEKDGERLCIAMANTAEAQRKRSIRLATGNWYPSSRKEATNRDVCFGDFVLCPRLRDVLLGAKERRSC